VTACSRISRKASTNASEKEEKEEAKRRSEEAKNKD
jgi:hypothetical protein